MNECAAVMASPKDAESAGNRIPNRKTGFATGGGFFVHRTLLDWEPHRRQFSGRAKTMGGEDLTQNEVVRRSRLGGGTFFHSVNRRWDRDGIGDGIGEMGKFHFSFLRFVIPLCLLKTAVRE